MSVNGFVHDAIVGSEPLTSPVSLTHQLLHSSPPQHNANEEDDIDRRVVQHLTSADVDIHPDLIAQTEAQLAQQQQQQAAAVVATTAATITNDNNTAIVTNNNNLDLRSPSLEGTGVVCPVCQKSYASSSDSKGSLRSHFRHMISKNDAEHRAYRDAEKEAKSKEVAASAKSKARDRVRKFRAARAEEARKAGPLGIDRAKIQSKSATERRKLKKEVDAIPPPGPEPAVPVLPGVLDVGRPVGNPYYLLGEVVGVKPPVLRNSDASGADVVAGYKATLEIVAPGQTVANIFERCGVAYSAQGLPWSEAMAKYDGAEEGSHEEMVKEYVGYLKAESKYRKEMDEYQVAIEKHRKAVEEYEKLKDIESRVRENVNNWWESKGRMRLGSTGEAGADMELSHEGDAIGESMEPQNQEQAMSNSPPDPEMMDVTEDTKVEPTMDTRQDHPEIDPQITTAEAATAADEVMVDPNIDMALQQDIAGQA